MENYITLRNKAVVSKSRNKPRVTKNRKSSDIFEFQLTASILFDENSLPTYEKVLNYYFYLVKSSNNKSSAIYNVAKSLHEIWISFINENNLIIDIVKLPTIQYELEKIIKEWKKLEKDVSKEDLEKEAEWSIKMKRIFNIAKGTDKSYFIDDGSFDLNNLPKGKTRILFPCYFCSVMCVTQHIN